MLKLKRYLAKILVRNCEGNEVCDLRKELCTAETCFGHAMKAAHQTEIRAMCVKKLQETDRLMSAEHILNFERRDFLPTAADDLLEAAAEREVAVRIHPALVPGAKPAARPAAVECLNVRVLVAHVGAVLVTRGHHRAAHTDLRRKLRRALRTPASWGEQPTR